MESQIAQQLHERHETAKRLSKERNLDEYLKMFSPHVRYTDSDGETLDFASLVHAFQHQFESMK